jgi:hypothetical protein
MRGRTGFLGVVVTLLLIASGCCRFCDHCCGPRQTACAPVAVAPAASPCCCVPCQPGTVAAAPPAVPAATGWNQPCTCGPVH